MTTLKTIARGATLLLTIAAMGMGCSGKRAKFAPPSDAPEPPTGGGWFCFHATSPHAISFCKQDSKICTKVRNTEAAKKNEMMEDMPEKPRAEMLRRAPRKFFAAPSEADDLEIEGSDTPTEPESGEGFGNICSIDPSSCPLVDSARYSIPTYSTCAPKDVVYCSPYYHEFNFYAKYEENHWRYYCAESAKSCEAWRDLWHLHLVKRPCVPVR